MGSGEDATQYKEGLKKAVDLINTLIDQISDSPKIKNLKEGRRKEIEFETDDKENIQPLLTERMRKDKSSSLNDEVDGKKFVMSSQRELKSLIQVIKKAKAREESLRSSKNFLET